MIDNWLSKTKIKKLIEKFVKKIFFGRISANNLTIIGLVLGLSSAFFIFLSAKIQYTFEFVFVAAILMTLSFFFDALDGILARLEGQTIFGGILDIFCDRTVETFIIIALISTDPELLVWPGIFSLGAIILCITMFLVVGGAIKAEELDETQKVIYYRRGLMERFETFIFLMIIILIIALRLIFLWLFAILVFITAILRFRDAYLIFKTKSNMSESE
ncbi:MAG: CDP-alcohol phosphatidyltransferase family protein [Promethearchaeota archaeon]|nr:MAG: CDP-alcohol phosphatidyltransferase family protein [Candidatus Lokiarchaeota archaeon]